MNRGAFVTGLGAVLAAPRIISAQLPRLWKIGWLFAGSRDAATVGFDAFRDEMKGLGHVENRDYVVEGRFASGQMAHLPSLAADLAARRVDLIIAPGTPSALAAKHATRDLAIVMVTVADPVGAGLVRSLARPEGNVTGTALALDELSPKWLELLRATGTRVTRVAVIQNSTNRSMPVMLRPLEDSARALHIRLRVHDAVRSETLADALKTAAMQRSDAVIILPDAYLQTARAQIVEALDRLRLPAIFAARADVVAGGLMSYGPDFVESYRRAAVYADKLLRGAKPGDLPVERSMKFELAINLKTAKALGLAIPPSLLLRADQVIE